jgi:hypothetical protein
VAETLATCVIHAADVLRRGQCATWHIGNVYNLDTWQIVKFSTTGSTMPPTRCQLHVANSLSCTCMGPIHVATCK